MNTGRERIYLDHAATTPIAPEVFDAMRPYLQGAFGNPSSQHSFGREAAAAIDEARDAVAHALGASAAEITFTSGGTESDNLAVVGAALANQSRGRHIITSSVEHHAVLEACQWLETQGFKVTYLPVDPFGMVQPDELRRAIAPETILVSIMRANNEIGTINPIAELSAIAREAGAIFHTDAVQAFGVLPTDVNELGVDMLSLSAHKIYGPKGSGALYVRQGVRVSPLFRGGSQERGRRPGTQNVAGIVGLGAASKLATSVMDEAPARIRDMRNLFESLVMREIDDVHLNGHPTLRLPGISNLAFPGTESEMLMLNLDLAGVAVSTGSACAAGAVEASHVLQALGRAREVAGSSVRFSLGRGTTREEIGLAIDLVSATVERLRRR